MTASPVKTKYTINGARGLFSPVCFCYNAYRVLNYTFVLTADGVVAGITTMFTKDQIKPVIILFYVVLAASLWKCFAFPHFDSEPTQNNFWLGATPLFAALTLFGLIPMGIVQWGFREPLADYGLQFGIVPRTLRTFFLAAPVIVGIAILTGHQSAFFEVYPLNETIRPQNTKIGMDLFVLHAICYLGYYFGWEFLFRGFLQHGLAERCGVPVAILVQTLASTMLHYGHPSSEVFGAMIAGLVWGLFVYRTRSILSGLGQHALLGILLDWMLIFRNTDS